MRIGRDRAQMMLLIMLYKDPVSVHRCQVRLSRKPAPKIIRKTFPPRISPKPEVPQPCLRGLKVYLLGATRPGRGDLAAPAASGRNPVRGYLGRRPVPEVGVVGSTSGRSENVEGSMEHDPYEFHGSRPSASGSKRRRSETGPTPPSIGAKMKKSGVELAALVNELLHNLSDQNQNYHN